MFVFFFSESKQLNLKCEVGLFFDIMMKSKKLPKNSSHVFCLTYRMSQIAENIGPEESGEFWKHLKNSDVLTNQTSQKSHRKFF
ncbi:hypothetical protein B5F17_02225 [Butyricicoccus pullicaecorum]|uniref:Uncharacterized protein n=1 Tax=Butyricicoccus pullicaecorum TaxID=501571 RepID=A0A1Y4LBE4_9FIRM|nr:hypothetical protein B5F17_02225 [Butyricicoccus pullicaecorum]